MKKIIPFVFMFVFIAGCSAKTYTPVINTAFTVNAVYQTGDFSYNCKIIKTQNDLTVVPTSTNAKDMMITYDGKSVTYKKEKMIKSFASEKINKTNPAIVLYEVFSFLENTEKLNVSKTDNGFEYTGKISAGNFRLMQNNDNSFKSITIANADIEIIFDDE